MAKRGPKAKPIEKRGRKAGTHEYRSDLSDKWIEEIADAYVADGMPVRRAALLATQHHVTQQLYVLRIFENVQLNGEPLPPNTRSKQTKKRAEAILRHVRLTKRFGPSERVLLQKHPNFTVSLPEPTTPWIDPTDHVAQRIAQRIYRKMHSKTNR